MTPSRLVRASALCAVLAVTTAAPGAWAQPRPERRQAVPVEADSAAQRPVVQAIDAEGTRQAFEEVLRRHPPSVGRVMKLDPSLMRNETYLQSYPQIQQFLEDHPEVPLNASFYLHNIRAGVEEWTPPSPRERLVEGILGGLAGMTAFFVLIGTIIWLVRTVIEHRRWNRLSRIQAEVHTKLMDRFSSNDELIKYVQTAPGRRFLESGPSPLQEAHPAVSAPFSRILWSVQLGSVLVVAGLGFLFLSGRAVAEVREFFYIAGCLASAIGAGFLVSAGAAYFLSRRLGLLDRPAPAQDHA